MADSKQTRLCTYLSAVLLAGPVFNSLFGWSWADPIVALVITAVAVKEGREAWRGDSCCAPPAVTEMSIAGYAGTPLTDADGTVLGALCAIDHEPRD